MRCTFLTTLFATLVLIRSLLQVNVTGILPNGQEYEPYTFYYTPDSASAPMSCNLNAYGLPRLQRLGAVRFESAAGFLTGTAETLFDRIFTTKYY